MIASLLDTYFTSKLEIVESNDDTLVFAGGFPSVTKGYLDISKCKKLLNFVPSNPIESFKNMIKFYDIAYTMYPKHRKEVENELRNEMILNPKDKVEFNKFINSKIGKQ